MTYVASSVRNLDLSAICEDEDCAQKGLPFAEHSVVHKSKGAKKGLRGTCPECEGPMHNMKDDAKLIAFACLWRQQFGDAARKTPVSAVNLEAVVKSITSGKITRWADRNLMHTILSGGSVAPKAAPATATSSPSPVVLTAPTTTASTRPAMPSVAPSPSPVPAAANTTKDVDPAEAAKKKAALGALLKQAKVNP
jgi:hypothetical protein